MTTPAADPPPFLASLGRTLDDVEGPPPVKWIEVGMVGHEHLVVTERRGGTAFRCSCQCGYESTNRQTVRLAVEAGNHHVLTVWRRRRLDGLDGRTGASTTGVTPPAHTGGGT